MIGKRINGRYRIISRIGDGGMSIVYKAEDLILERLVAVKVLRSEFSSDESFIRRFRREAEAVAGLSDPNIVSIYDIGEEEELHYIVMEFVDGLTLKTYIQQYAPIPSRDAIFILKQIATALQHAHEQGLVHRDIKPQNILIDDQDHVKITDFGIALAVSSATITFTNSIMGSAHYLSPEQAKGQKATAKSDIYAFGIVMYEMLTGHLPFPGDSPVTVALKHLNESFTRPKVLNPNLPQSLENIIMRSMAKSPDDRFQNMNEVYESLNTALHPDRLNEAPYEVPDRDVDQTRIIPPLGVTETNLEDAPMLKASVGDSRPHAKDPDPPQKQKKKKRVVLWTTLGIIALILIAAAIFLLPKLLFVPNVTVPNVQSKTYDEAVNLLSSKHLYVKKKVVENDQKPSGIVVQQSPVNGSKVKVNSTVTLSVSKGPRKQEVPDYVGYDRSTVNQLLKDNKYKDVVWHAVPSDTIPDGQVLSQKPDPNAQIIPSETVLELTYSTGPEKIQLPDVTGEPQDQATTDLQNLGLKVNVQDGDYSDSVQQGNVLKTNPNPGDEVTKGDSVTIYISKGPKPQPVDITVPIPVEVTSNGPGDNGKGNGKGNGNAPSTVHVQITYTDASHQDAVFKEEDISQSTTYSLPLTINPASYASYKVVIDGNTVEQKTIQYSDVQQSSSNGSD